MPITSVEIMKTIDERELQKTTKQKQTKTERSKGNRNHSQALNPSLLKMHIRHSESIKSLKAILIISFLVTKIN